MNKHVVNTAQFATIEGRVLAEALKPLIFVVERRTTYPVLTTVKIDVEGSILRLTGTDLDVEVVAELDVIDASGDWSICVDARLLASIAGAAAVAEMRIELVEQVIEAAKKGERPVTAKMLHITVGEDIRYDVETVISADGFPMMTGERGDLIERFGNGLLVDLLRKTSWCISTEETRYYLNGVCWQAGPNGCRFVATDGHRLAMCRYDAAPVATATSRIIPRKTVLLLQRFFAGQNVSVYARCRDGVESGIHIVADNITIRSKLIEGTFPDVDRVIPRDEPNHRLIVNRQELTDAIGKVSVMARRDFGRAIQFAPGSDGHLTVRGRNSDLGTAEVRLSTPWPEDAPSFGFNGRYITELLAHCCDGEVTIDQKDAGAPFVINDSDETMTRVLMPMRV